MPSALNSSAVTTDESCKCQSGDTLEDLEDVEAQIVREDEPTEVSHGDTPELDNALARRALGDAGFKLVVEAGLGSGARDFRAIRIHTFPGAKDPRDIWTSGGERVVNVELPAYGDLKCRGLDQCGVTLLAGRAVGAPFVGMTAATICLSEILRLLHDGQLFYVHELDLKVPASRVCVQRSTKLTRFNPGFTAIQ